MNAFPRVARQLLTRLTVAITRFVGRSPNEHNTLHFGRAFGDHRRAR